MRILKLLLQRLAVWYLDKTNCSVIMGCQVMGMVIADRDDFYIDDVLVEGKLVNNDYTEVDTQYKEIGLKL